MLRILKMLKWKEWVYAALAVGLIVAQVWLDLTLPDYMATVTELSVSGAAAAMGEIWKNGGIMLACALGSALSSVAVRPSGSESSSGAYQQPANQTNTTVVLSSTHRLATSTTSPTANDGRTFSVSRSYLNTSR